MYNNIMSVIIRPAAIGIVMALNGAPVWAIFGFVLLAIHLASIEKD